MGRLIIARGAAILLRDRERDSDVEAWVRWQVGGVWREWDAPWETLALKPTAERLDGARRGFLEACDTTPAEPREEAIIATSDGVAIGWVRRYGERRFPDAWSLGIGIGEDRLIGRGYGSEALRLWIQYLFRKSSIHRLALATFSFNQRMIRVAEKVGMTHEGAERELVCWNGRWQDRVRFGILRQEWEQTEKA